MTVQLQQTPLVCYGCEAQSINSTIISQHCVLPQSPYPLFASAATNMLLSAISLAVSLFFLWWSVIWHDVSLLWTGVSNWKRMIYPFMLFKFPELIGRGFDSSLEKIDIFILSLILGFFFSLLKLVIQIAVLPFAYLESLFRIFFKPQSSNIYGFFMSVLAFVGYGFLIVELLATFDGEKFNPLPDCYCICMYTSKGVSMWNHVWQILTMLVIAVRLWFFFRRVRDDKQMKTDHFWTITHSIPFDVAVKVFPENPAVIPRHQFNGLIEMNAGQVCVCLAIFSFCLLFLVGSK
jgi:hypothetical protein